MHSLSVNFLVLYSVLWVFLVYVLVLPVRVFAAMGYMCLRNLTEFMSCALFVLTCICVSAASKHTWWCLLSPFLSLSFSLSPVLCTFFVARLSSVSCFLLSFFLPPFLSFHISKSLSKSTLYVCVCVCPHDCHTHKCAHTHMHRTQT